MDVGHRIGLGMNSRRVPSGHKNHRIRLLTCSEVLKGLTGNARMYRDTTHDYVVFSDARTGNVLPGGSKHACEWHFGAVINPIMCMVHVPIYPSSCEGDSKAPMPDSTPLGTGEVGKL